MAYTEEDDPPLDPVMERVRRKMIRLMVISVGIMMIGILAVLYTIVYKISNPSDAEDKALISGDLPLNAEIKIPPGSKVVKSFVAENRLVLEVLDSEDNPVYLIIYLSTGEVIWQLSVVPVE